MKKLTNHIKLVTAIACCVSGAAIADEAPSCRPDKLDGLYVFSATGYTIVSGVAQPKAIVELIRFNGDGTLTVPGATRSLNGVIAEIPPGGTGTYVLAPDCRGSLVFNGGPSFDIFASPRGEDLWIIQTNANNVLQGNVTRVSP
jgi:hypothetical protein